MAERASAVVTILFTDLVSSTELLARAGDEEAQRIFRAHHNLLGEVAAGCVDEHHWALWAGGAFRRSSGTVGEQRRRYQRCGECDAGEGGAHGYPLTVTLAAAADWHIPRRGDAFVGERGHRGPVADVHA